MVTVTLIHPTIRLKESEVVTAKSQTEALPYRPSNSEISTAR